MVSIQKKVEFLEEVHFVLIFPGGINSFPQKVSTKKKGIAHFVRQEESKIIYIHNNIQGTKPFRKMSDEILKCRIMKVVLKILN